MCAVDGGAFLANRGRVCVCMCEFVCVYVVPAALYPRGPPAYCLYIWRWAAATHLRPTRDPPRAAATETETAGRREPSSTHPRPTQGGCDPPRGCGPPRPTQSRRDPPKGNVNSRRAAATQPRPIGKHKWTSRLCMLGTRNKDT